MADPTEAEKAAAAEKEAADKAAADKAAASGDGEDKTGLRAALAKQAGEKDAAYAALEKKLHARDAADLAAKEKKLKDDGETQKLLELRVADLADRDDTIKELKRSQLSNKAWKALQGLGMADTDKLELYSTAKLPQDATAESIEEWAKLLKADSPDKFTAPVVKVGQASVGELAIDAGSANWKDVEAQMESDDPEKRKKARDLLTAYYQEHGKFPD